MTTTDPREVVATEQDLEDLITDAIDDSMDMDWTGRVGAQSVLRALTASGLSIVPVAVGEQAPLSCRLKGPVDIEDAAAIDASESRAEAAEASLAAVTAERDRMVEALGDLLSWFPEQPSKPEWRIEAGQYGADDAINAARAALTNAEDRT